MGNAQYQTKILSHFKKNIFRKPMKISQSVRKENPRNSPRDPPASAKNDLRIVIITNKLYMKQIYLKG